jgi:photosystem II stability/assembly factor-like uncharacterized protein
VTLSARIRNRGNVWWILLGLCLAAAPAAAELEPGQPSSWLLPGGDLYGVDTVGSSVVAVGYWGTVLRSVDGGERWSHQPTPTNETLYAVSFGDESRGWAVGAAGTLLYSDDAGVSWTSLSVQLPADEFQDARPLDIPLFDVSAVSGHEAWAVGDFGVVLHTKDGTQWEVVAIPPEAFADENIPDRILNAVDFGDRENGWIVGEFGTALRTEDGGATWNGAHTFTGAVEDVYLMDVAAGGDGLAVAIGTGGVVIQTQDSGATWMSIRLGTTAGLFGIASTDASRLLVGDRGVVFESRDQGTSWSEPTRPRLFNWFRDVALGADGQAYLVGQNGIILRSTDGGATWAQSAGAEPPPLDGVSSPAPPSSPPAVEPQVEPPDEPQDEPQDEPKDEPQH